MSTRTIQGYYGSRNTPCNIFVYDLRNGTSWYVVEGSVNVNLCDTEDLVLGVNVEELYDYDTSSSRNPIGSEDDLEKFIDDDDDDDEEE